MSSKYRTSRGQIAETEEIIINIMATVDHLLDMPDRSINDDAQIKLLREVRASLMETYAKKEDIDIRYHCAYKHLLKAKGQLWELIESYITYGQDVTNLNADLDKIIGCLNHVRLSYLGINPDDLEDPECPKCLEDYLMNRGGGFTDEEIEALNDDCCS